MKKWVVYHFSNGGFGVVKDSSPIFELVRLPHYVGHSKSRERAFEIARDHVKAELRTAKEHAKDQLERLWREEEESEPESEWKLIDRVRKKT